ITEIRTIKSKKGVSWSCRNCNILSSDINDLKAAILSLAAREKSAGIDDKAFEELLAELGDRNNRKQNIIMFGVPESDTHDANTRRSRELETVQAVLKALPSAMNTDHIELDDIKSVSIYCSPHLERANYVIEFYNHDNAAYARHILISRKAMYFEGDVAVNWPNRTGAEPKVIAFDEVYTTISITNNISPARRKK
ncbi:hypothetical protein Trydic_g269, partial [Trypoxylus dichotomus]